MTKKTFELLSFFLLLLFGTNLMAQEINVQPNIVLLDYLSGYCDEGEEVTFIDFVQNNAQTLQPVLIGIVREGVPDKMIQDLQSKLAKQYSERQKLLNEDLNFGLSEEDLQLIRAESQEEFNERMIQEYRDGFMSQAIFGLSLIDSSEAQTIIKQIADDDNNSYHRAAQNAMNKVYLKQQ